MQSGLHQEIARQRQLDLRREADTARRAAQVRREVPSIVSFTPVFARWEGLAFLSRRRGPLPTA
jgi:hypothetical protein